MFSGQLASLLQLPFRPQTSSIKLCNVSLHWFQLCTVSNMPKVHAGSEAFALIQLYWLTGSKTKTNNYYYQKHMKKLKQNVQTVRSTDLRNVWWWQHEFHEAPVAEASWQYVPYLLFWLVLPRASDSGTSTAKEWQHQLAKQRRCPCTVKSCGVVAISTLSTKPNWRIGSVYSVEYDNNKWNNGWLFYTNYRMQSSW